MMAPEFFSSAVVWVGQGTIRFSETTDELHFYTRWAMEERLDDGFDCSQEVEIEGIPETMCNSYIVSDLTASSFHIQLTNPALGTVIGQGLVDNGLVAWEFRAPNFEGYETYQQQQDGTYEMHAEYTSADQLRTIVHASLRRAEEEPLSSSD